VPPRNATRQLGDTAPRPTATSKPSARSKRRVWGIEDLRNLKSMTAEAPNEMLRELDMRGMSPVTFAAIMAALQTDSLLPLLSLLEPKEGESNIDVLVSAIEKVLDTQKQIIADQAVMKSMLLKLGRKVGA
jgi:hypothetical protein